ncbi:MAG: copper resistance D family protein, partial [Angustibacter sp.]
MSPAASVEPPPRVAARPGLAQIGGVGLLTGAVALVVTLISVQPPTLADPGEFVRWALPINSAIRSLALAVTIGLLGLVTFALPGALGRSARGDLGTTGRYALRWAALAAAVWAGSSALQAVLSYANIAGTGLFTPGLAEEFLTFAPQLAPLRNELLVALIALVVSVGALLAVRLRPTLWLTVLALLGLWPLALTGHSGTDAQHEQAVDGVLLHLLGIVAWCGGLLALCAMRNKLQRELSAVLGRFSWLAGWAFLLVAGSGVVNTAVRVQSVEQWKSPYGAILAAKIVILGILGAAGWWHRNSLLQRMREASGAEQLVRAAVSRVFWRLISAELILLAAAMGLGIALSGID